MVLVQNTGKDKDDGIVKKYLLFLSLADKNCESFDILLSNYFLKM